MRKMMEQRGIGRRKKTKESKEEAGTDEEQEVEIKILEQPINTDELRNAIRNREDWKERDRKVAMKILENTEEEQLAITYRRKRKGRWYALGAAQIQSCKKEIREVALKGTGLSIDLRTSFPAIVTGLIEEISRETNT